MTVGRLYHTTKYDLGTHGTMVEDLVVLRYIKKSGVILVVVILVYYI